MSIDDEPVSREGRGARRSIVRLAVSLAIGIATALVVDVKAGWAVSVVAGWDAGTFAMLSLAWATIWSSDSRVTRARAGGDDPGRAAVWVLVSLSSVAAFFAAAVVLHGAKTIAPGESTLLIVLSLAAVVLSWLLTHTAFTLRYARIYYRPKDGEGGIELPGKADPDDLDFAYFAFTIGMCFQVSDVVISSKPMRVTALVHAMLSFAYNTVILALTLNIFMTLLG